MKKLGQCYNNANLKVAPFSLPLFLLLSLLMLTPPQLRAFSPDEGFKACSYYVELEEIMKCDSHYHSSADLTQKFMPGKSRYLIDYALKYCLRFLQAEETSSPAFVQWSRETRICLQKELRDHPNKMLSCQKMEAYAIKTHEDCYKSSGFCNLSISEKREILSLVRFRDLMRGGFNNLVKVIKLGLSCL